MTTKTFNGTVTDTALILPDDLSYEDWAEYGRGLDRMARAAMWWLGDWWAYGQHRYGDRAKTATETQWAFQTCRDAGWVARSIETSRRRDVLPWTYHKEVAALEPDDQEHFLSRWEKQTLTDGKPPKFTAIRSELSDFKRDRNHILPDITPQSATIIQADYTDWLTTQPNCDLLITDPPYSTDIDNIERFAAHWLPLALDKTLPTGHAYICIGAYPNELRTYLNITVPQHLTLANILVWTYRNTLGPSPKYSYQLNWQAILYYQGIHAAPLNCPEMLEQFAVHDINAPDARHHNRWHRWQKPDQLAERFIRHATQSGDLVLDPFAGTGTFLLAAARLGRSAHGCELDPDNLAIAIKRGCQHA